MGAIHLEGTKGVTMESCLVTRVDGNAVMLSGWVAYSTREIKLDNYPKYHRSIRLRGRKYAYGGWRAWSCTDLDLIVAGRYNRNTTISKNEFVWVSAPALVKGSLCIVAVAVWRDGFSKEGFGAVLDGVDGWRQIGDSVIASWGYTAPLRGAAGDEILAQYRSGVDGTNGEQP
jgi:hypothetical protein